MKVIFSDDSGAWHNDEYYVRSFIIFESESDYVDAKKIVVEKNKELGIDNEIKWERIRKHLISRDNKTRVLVDAISNEINFSIVLTYTYCPDFLEAQYLIRNNLKTVLNNGNLGSAFKKEFFQQKVLHDVNNSMFYNLYERGHLIQILKYFESLDKNPKVFFDKPAYHQRYYESILDDLNFQHYEIVDSKEYIGVQLADVVAGAFREFLEGNSDFFYEFLKPRLSSYKFFMDKQITGISRVFWDGRISGLKELEKIRASYE